MAKALNIKDCRFGRLSVKERHGITSNGDALWLCFCDCGNKKIARAASLNSGDTKSFGCLHDESARERATKHGKAYDPIYNSWADMIKRCFNKNHQYYHRYGGRGITVCERWREFKNFYEDMGDRPDNKSLDRIDNDGNYELSNCRWATRATQAQNRSS